MALDTPLDEELGRALTAIDAGRHPSDVESVTLDFKEDHGDQKAVLVTLAEASVCFANARGGLVVLGLDDDTGGPAAYTGTSLHEHDVRKGIYDRTRPQLLVDVRSLERHGIRLLVVVITEGIGEVWTDAKGRPSTRIGSHCLPMSVDAASRLREERMGFDASARPTAASVADVSPLSMALARQQLRRLPDEGRTRLAEASDHDLLRQLGVLTEDGHLRAAGYWMLCPPNSGAPEQIVYEYRLTPSGEPQFVERLQQPLLDAFVRVADLISARRTVTPVNLPDGQQLAVEDFPEVAVREAIANAVVHRDHRLRGPVAVVQSPDVFHVTSPGPLVTGVTLDNILTTTSRPRNPLLTTTFRTLGLAEQLGVGVDRMYREMVRAGRQLPQFEASFDRVRVALTGGAPAKGVVRYVAQLPQRERDDTDTMLVLVRLCGTRTVTAATAAPVLQKLESEAEQILRRLAADDVAMLEPTRETLKHGRPTYRLRSDALRVLGAAVRYRRRTQDDIDRKVMAHVREYGRVTNATVRNLLDVSTPRASAILKDLRQRDVISKTSDAERGPTVEYGPGPAFPDESAAGSDARRHRTDEPTLFDV